MTSKVYLVTCRVAGGNGDMFVEACNADHAAALTQSYFDGCCDDMKVWEVPAATGICAVRDWSEANLTTR